MQVFVAAFSFMLALATAASAWAQGPVYIHEFTSVNGGNNVNPVVGYQTGADPSTWALYGTTKSGGPGNAGIFYKLTPPALESMHWTETQLYLFGSVPSDSNPVRSLVFDASGAVYGILSNTLTKAPSSIFKLTPPSAGESFWRKTTVYTFSTNDQGAPFSLLVDKSGTLYVDELNQSLAIPGSYGAIVKLTPPVSGQGTWTPTILHNFVASDGQIPAVAPVLDDTGAIYGATNTDNFDYRKDTKVGVLYKLSQGGPKKPWSYTKLYYFPGIGGDAGLPAHLLRNEIGAFFVFSDNGENSFVFRLKPPTSTVPHWTRTEMASFSMPSIRAGGLAILDSTGSVYGTILQQEGPRYFYTGYPFRLDPPKSGTGTWTVTRLVNFGATGENLNGEIIKSPSGRLFSSTSDHNTPGGSVSYGGAVFRTPMP